MLLLVTIALLLWRAIGFASATAPDAGETNGTVVAIVLSEKIRLPLIDPQGPALEESIKHLDTHAFQEWLLDQRTQALLRHVEPKLLAEYGRIAGVKEPSQQAIDQYLAMKRRASDELRSILASNIVAADQELRRTDISQARRDELSTRRRILGSHSLMRAEEQGGAGSRSSDLEEARLFIRLRDVNLALLRQYGGRTLLSTLGYSVPIDARRKYLEDCEKRGDLRILDDEIRRKFWELLDEREKGAVVPDMPPTGL